MSKETLKAPFWIIVAAVVVLAAAAVYLLTSQINANKLSPLRDDAVYRNGLYFVTSEIENGEASAAFQTDFIYYDGTVTGEIKIAEQGEFEWDDTPDGRDAKDAYLNDLQNKYVFTWTSGMDEHQMDTFNKHHWGYTYSEGIFYSIVYGIEADESIPAGKEDIVIRIYITNFDQPLEFIIPAQGTAPEMSIVYGTFSPSDIIYLSPAVSDDSKAFLNAAKNVVFNVYDNVLAVYNPADNDVIREATYRLSISGIALDDTISYYGLDAVPEVDISRYTSKIMYFADGLGENNDQCAVMLMDDETWIGYWRWVEDEADGHQLKCDYIFKVKNTDD